MCKLCDFGLSRWVGGWVAGVGGCVRRWGSRTAGRVAGRASPRPRTCAHPPSSLHDTTALACRIIGQDQTHVDTQSYGTATHASPELLMQGKLTTAADVYALSLISAWHCLLPLPAAAGGGAALRLPASLPG